MEKLTLPTQNQPTEAIQTQEALQLQGPDGHIFNVVRSVESTAALTEIPDTAARLSEAHSMIENAYSNDSQPSSAVVAEKPTTLATEEPRGNDPLAVGLGAAVIGVGLYKGIRKAAKGIKHRAPKTTGAASKANARTRRMEIGERALRRLNPLGSEVDDTGAPLNPYDSIDRWATSFHTHTRNPGSMRGQERAKANYLPRTGQSPTGNYDRTRPDGPAAPYTTTPGSAREQRLELGVAKHVNKANFYDREAVKQLNLYGEAVKLEGDELKTHLSRIPMTRAQRRAIIKASKVYHHASHKAHDHVHVIEQVAHGTRKRIPWVKGARLDWTK